MPLAKHTKLNGLMQASTLNSRSLCGLQSLVSVPSAPPRPNLVQVICTLLPSWLSKSEPALELDPPVAAGAIAAATSDEGGRFAEIGRTQIPVRQGKVGVVQQISGQGGESQLHRIALPLRLFAQLESLGQAEGSEIPGRGRHRNSAELSSGRALVRGRTRQRQSGRRKGG